jgi:hypothetical protein
MWMPWGQKGEAGEAEEEMDNEQLRSYEKQRMR